MAIEIWTKDPVTNEKYLAWVAVNAFAFIPYQVDWLLEYLPLRNEGRWPPKPSISGYVDSPQFVQHSINLHAPFEAPAAVWVELWRRLSALGLSGERAAILEHYIMDKTWAQIAADCHITEFELDFRVGRAVKYIASGTCARFQECTKCVFSGRCKRLDRLRQKGRTRKVWTWEDWKAGNLKKHRIMRE